MTELNWVGMLAVTQKSRNEKSRKIRLCRHYISVARRNGYSEKSTSVRSWKMELADCRAIEIEVS